MEKSLQYYNFQAAKKKEDIIANKEWATSFKEIPSPTIPKQEKVEKVKFSVGAWNLARQLIP